MTHPDKIQVHMIGNAHIDPVWLWPCQEGREEVVSTYRTAIDLIALYDAYVFTSGGAVTYQWVQEDDPALFEAIVGAAKAGKWALVNGWWLQPDCNIPHGESFARHALYGQRYLQEHMGQIASVGYNVDSFGHAGTLPQLLRLAGLDSYLFFRPDPHEKELPVGPFWWESPDGSRVLTCRPPLHYNSPEEENMRERIGIAAQAATDSAPMVICFYGVGNHGGGPTRANIADLVALMAEDSPIEPIFSTPARYFEAVKARSADWPVVHDELQHHSRGCYTALTRVKKENRRSERLLMQAERLGTLAHRLGGAASPRREIDAAWEPVLFNQFHDILAGTSIQSAYEDVWAGYAAANSAAKTVRERSLQALTACVAPVSGEHTMVVWNPLAWERTESTTIEIPSGGFRQNRDGTVVPTAVSVRDESGVLLPSQIDGVELDDNHYIAHVTTSVTVPALGWKMLSITIEQERAPRAGQAPVQVKAIENEHLTLEFDPGGWLAALRDKATGLNFLSEAGGVPLIIDDPSDTWSHDVVSFRDVISEFEPVCAPEVISSGTAATTVRLCGAWGESRITQEYTLARDSHYVDLTLTIDWHEQLKMLKLAFPVNAARPCVSVSAPYGAISRQANGKEEPCQAWVDLYDESTGNGITFVNDGTYGYDALGCEFRQSLLRSPIYAFHRPRQIIPGMEYHYIDQGRQVIRMRLLPHLGPAGPGAIGRADYALHEPLLACPADGATGTWPGSGSLLSCEPENVLLTVVRENAAGGLVVRGLETAGTATDITLTSLPTGQSWTHRVRAHEVWTLLLEQDSCTPLDFLDRPLRR